MPLRADVALVYLGLSEKKEAEGLDRTTLALPKNINVPCPQCGAELLERVSRKGRKFYGCERYPECDFVSWDLPVKEKCPVCGGRMVQKRGAKDTLYHVCVNETCRHRVQVETGGQDDAE